MRTTTSVWGAVVVMGLGTALCRGACPDVAGFWYMTEFVDATDCDEGMYTVTYCATATQEGCRVTGFGPSGRTLEGEIDGNTLRLTGSYPEDGGITTMRMDLLLEESGEEVKGETQWTWGDPDFPEWDCRGGSVVSGYRIADPVACFTFTPADPAPGQVVAFDALCSENPNEDGILSYNWRFGDGGDAAGVRVEHAYADAGRFPVTLTVLLRLDECSFETSVTQEVTVASGSVEVPFRRGDTNSDGTVNIADAVNTLGYLFGGQAEPECLEAADANNDNSVNIADAVAILGHLFSNTGPLPDPFAECGVEASEDTVPCRAFAPCE